jgi:general secretion pathway protein G
MTRRNQKGFTLIELLIVVAIIGIIAAIAIPNLLNAIDRGKQKRTMADLRSVGTAVESYSIDNNVYPVATDMSTLEGFVEPVYIRTAPLTDGWTRTFQVASAIGEYTLCSGGKDGGTCTGDAGGAQTSFNASISFANGQFVQWPEGTQQ